MPDSPPHAHPVQPPSWTQALWQRFRYRQILKLVGVSGFIWIFFIGYFALLRHPVHPVTVMPQGPLDHWVGFQPWALWPYLSLWVYVGIPAGFAVAMRPLLAYGGWAALMCGVGLAIFYLWPTAVPADAQPADAVRHLGFGVLRGVDAPGNASPSMHVAAAVFAAAWTHRMLRQVAAPRGFAVANLLWCAAIVWSTMATKQHVAADVAAGLLLGGVFAALSLRATRHMP